MYLGNFFLQLSVIEYNDGMYEKNTTTALTGYVAILTECGHLKQKCEFNLQHLFGNVTF